MPGSVLLMAALLLGQPPAMLPPDPLWEACEDGGPAKRIAGCTAIVSDAEFDVPSRAWALLLRALAHEDQGHRRAAIADLGHAIRLQPDGSLGYRLRGEILADEKRFDEARADFDRSIELAPTNAYAFLARASFYFETGSFKAAREDIETAIALDPQMAGLYFERGRIALRMGDPDQSVLDFQKVLELESDNDDAKYNLAVAHYELGRWKDARAALAAYMAARPRDAGAFRLRAMIALGEDDLGLAKVDIDWAAELNPYDPEIVLGRALVHRRRGELEAALQDYEASALHFPDDEGVLYGRGVTRFLLDDDSGALEDADAALKVDPASIEAHWLKASSLLYLDRYDDAFAAAVEGLKHEPKNVDLLVVRGRIQLLQDRPALALATLAEAVSVAPDSIDALAYRAVAADELGFSRQARADLEAVLGKDPGNEIALDRLAGILDSSGDLHGALDCRLRLRELFPEFASYAWQVADVSMRLGDREAALDAYADAIRLYGADAPPQLWRDYGHALGENEQWGEALAALRHALQTDPEDGWTRGKIGVAQFELGEYDAAIANLKRSVELYGHLPEGNEFRLYLGRAYSESGRDLSAIRELDALVSSAPTFVEALVGRAHVHLRLEQYGSASADVEAALKEAPDFVPALLVKADALQRTGKPDAALDVLAKAIAVAPDDPRAYFGRAVIRHGAGAFDAALADYDKALLLAPEDALYLNNRADALLRLGRLDDALYDAERATGLHPDYAPGWITLGEVLLEERRAADALPAFDRAIALKYAGPEPFFFRASAHSLLGHAAAARRDLAEAAARDRGAFAARIDALRRRLS